MKKPSRKPEAWELLHFVAEHESLALTVDEFPALGEERIRELLLSLAQPPAEVVRVPEPPRISTRDAAGRKVARLLRRTVRVVLNTDGASRGNPGPSGAGWVITGPEGELVREGCAFLGKRTNNEAEYEAVIRGIDEALALGVDELLLRSDSELLVKQLNGEYRVRNDRIAMLHARVREQMRQLRRVDVKYVPREQNFAADAMANEAIDKAMRC